MDAVVGSRVVVKGCSVIDFVLRTVVGGVTASEGETGTVGKVDRDHSSQGDPVAVGNVAILVFRLLEFFFEEMLQISDSLVGLGLALEIEMGVKVLDHRSSLLIGITTLLYIRGRHRTAKA